MSRAPFNDTIKQTLWGLVLNRCEKRVIDLKFSTYFLFFSFSFSNTVKLMKHLHHCPLPNPRYPEFLGYLPLHFSFLFSAIENVDILLYFSSFMLSWMVTITSSFSDFKTSISEISLALTVYPFCSLSDINTKVWCIINGVFL